MSFTPVLSNEGYCRSDRGQAPISSIGECSAAARALVGVTDSTAEENWFSTGRPEGCYWEPGTQQLYFSAAGRGDANYSTDDRFAVCMAVADTMAPTPPPTQPPSAPPTHVATSTQPSTPALTTPTTIASAWTARPTGRPTELPTLRTTAHQPPPTAAASMTASTPRASTTGVTMLPALSSTQQPTPVLTTPASAGTAASTSAFPASITPDGPTPDAAGAGSGNTDDGSSVMSLLLIILGAVAGVMLLGCLATVHSRRAKYQNAGPSTWTNPAGGSSFIMNPAHTTSSTSSDRPSASSGAALSLVPMAEAHPAGPRGDGSTSARNGPRKPKGGSSTRSAGLDYSTVEEQRRQALAGGGLVLYDVPARVDAHGAGPPTFLGPSDAAPVVLASGKTVRPVYATGTLVRETKGATVASTGAVYGSASQFARSTGTSTAGRVGGRAIVHEAMGSENEFYDLALGADGGREEVEYATVFESAAAGGSEDVQYATVDQTLLAMQRKRSPASASSRGGGGGGGGRVTYDNAYHDVNVDVGTDAAGYDAVEPRSGVVVYGIDDGGVGCTDSPVYDAPPARGAGTPPVYAVPNRTPSASSQGKGTRSRTSSGSRVVRPTHRATGEITAGQGTAARLLYKSLDRTVQPGRRMPGAEYAVINLNDGGLVGGGIAGNPNAPALPGRQYLARTASDRLVPRASGTGGTGSAGVSYHDMGGFGGDDTEA